MSLINNFCWWCGLLNDKIKPPIHATGKKIYHITFNSRLPNKVSDKTKIFCLIIEKVKDRDFINYCRGIKFKNIDITRTKYILTFLFILLHVMFIWVLLILCLSFHTMLSSLILRLMEAKDVVFECGPNCGCGPQCVNRTSQRGLEYRLEV